jgi:replication factor A3
MDKPTPRINSALREKYAGRTVRLTGKLVSVSRLVSPDLKTLD